MAYTLIWSPDARKDYFDILEYLESSWSKREVTRFINRTEQIFRLLIDNPFLFVASGKTPHIHRCVITRQISLFYRIRKNDIELLRFWDNRMDPKTLKY
jgi:plasmid stabilization system protein ParE